MYYFNGSHKIGLVNHVASNIKGSSQTVKDVKIYSKYHKITPSLNAGDALVHDSHIIHGSTKNNSKKNRMGLTIQFQSKNVRLIIKDKKFI